MALFRATCDCDRVVLYPAIIAGGVVQVLFTNCNINAVSCRDVYN